MQGLCIYIVDSVILMKELVMAKRRWVITSSGAEEIDQKIKVIPRCTQVNITFPHALWEVIFSGTTARETVVMVTYELD